METLQFQAVRYEKDLHEGFVRSSWCRGARERWETLAEYLRRPETMCVVAHLQDDPDSLLGWVAVTLPPFCVDFTVIWAYSRNLYGKVRRRGLMTSLLLACDVNLSWKPTPCLYWSPAASAIAARGYRIYHSPKRGQKEAA